MSLWIRTLQKLGRGLVEVSILVLLDVPLDPISIPWRSMIRGLVSILVLLDVPLDRASPLGRIPGLLGFQSLFCWMSLWITSTPHTRQIQIDIVSILVLLDVPLDPFNVAITNISVNKVSILVLLDVPLDPGSEHSTPGVV